MQIGNTTPLGADAPSTGTRIFRVMTAAIAHADAEGDQRTVDLLLVGKMAMVRHHDRQLAGDR